MGLNVKMPRLMSSENSMSRMSKNSLSLKRHRTKRWPRNFEWKKKKWISSWKLNDKSCCEKSKKNFLQMKKLKQKKKRRKKKFKRQRNEVLMKMKCNRFWKSGLSKKIRTNKIKNCFKYSENKQLKPGFKKRKLLKLRLSVQNSKRRNS